MNLVYFKTFLIVCELGNFTEAAKYLYVPQPTISNRMKSLEQELGQELFRKGGRGKRTAELTEAGKTFYPYAKQIIESIADVKEKINTASSQTLLKVGSSIPPSHPLIFYYLQEIEQLMNFMNIDVIDNDSAIMDLFADHSLDLAFVSTPIADRDIECHEIHRDALELIVSTDHPLAKMNKIDDIKELEGREAVIYSSIQKHLERTELLNIKYHRQLTTNSIEIMRKLLLYHHWLSFMPSQLMDDEIKKGYLVNIPIHNDFVLDSMRYYVVYRKNEKHEKIYHSIFKANLFTPAYLQPLTGGEIIQ